VDNAASVNALILSQTHYTVDPNTSALKSLAGVALPEQLPRLFQQLSPAWLPTSQLPRAIRSALLGPRSGFSAPARWHLSLPAEQSTWEPRIERAPRGGGSGEPAPPGSLAHCNAIWVVFPGPSRPGSAPSSCPRDAEGWGRLAL
jgi:hypothetical protein